MSFALAVSLRRCSRRMMAPAMSAGRQWQSTTATNSRKEDFDESPPLPLNTDSSESPSPLMDRIDKNVFQRMYDKYSIKQQTNRILVAESFLQAATCQASDP